MSTESYATQFVSLTDLLRRDQGNTLTLLCDNEEAETSDQQCAVEICAEFTEWKPQRFYGETVLAALWSAYKAAREHA